MLLSSVLLIKLQFGGESSETCIDVEKSGTTFETPLVGLLKSASLGWGPSHYNCVPLSFSFALSTLLVVCSTIGYRSGKYAESLRKEGFNASNLLGSILMWVSRHLVPSQCDFELFPTPRDFSPLGGFQGYCQPRKVLRNVVRIEESVMSFNLPSSVNFDRACHMGCNIWATVLRLSPQSRP